MNRRFRFAGVLALAVVAGNSGCFRRMTGRTDHLYEWPRVTVLDFDQADPAPTPYQTRLAPGLRASLVQRLCAGGRVVPVEPSRPTATRPANAVHPSLSLSPRYRIRTVIREFGHEPCRLPWHRRLATGHTQSERARVRLRVQVEDLRTNEVVLDRTFQAEAQAWPGAAASAYDGVAPNTPSFDRTPLGQCSGQVVAQVAEALEWRLLVELWVPRISRIRPDRITINGGLDRLIRVGWFYDVLKLDASGSDSPTVVGVVQVSGTAADYSLARTVHGGPFAPGMALRRNTTFGQSE